MDNNTLYTQCRVEKGSLTQITWLPKSYAVLGALLRLKNDQGVWEDGWKVTWCSATKLKEHQLTQPRDPRQFRKLLGRNKI
jgi:hypothetical protein